ncbi:helix-turn-helix domain-containing protein [Brevundimonas mediterranea]|uniref:HTH-type transcriptional regulator/antitoxin HipB n=1 Tax=Brevundimonas mediterranea TaxID=74329 RepID=A0A7W6A7P5_9CAUL|nr:helix-turn-helix domain-containing protein [Brevundimonas mediterranea]MBB3873275.1 HTH-type transcriptional regulator/antitoxin HipB [Brevundimonas mediterranea]
MDQIARSPGQVGAALQAARKAKGINQTTLAHLSGLRQEMVSKVETGQTGVKLATLFDLLAALDLELVIRPRSKSSAADMDDIF